MVVSGGDSLLVGPTALLLYKQYGLEAGLLFPVYQQTNFQPEEKFRFGVNLRIFSGGSSACGPSAAQSPRDPSTSSGSPWPLEGRERVRSAREH